jgi:hypothetical protein
MRFLLAAIIAISLLAILGLTATGGHSSSIASLSTTGPITKAEATAYANAVNLRVADVPEMISVGLEGEHKEPSLVDTACGLHESHVHVADVKSPTFRSGGNGGGVPLQEVKSDVEVVPTVALAARKLAHLQAHLQSPRDRACLERVYGQLFAKGLNKGRTHFSLGRTTVSSLRHTLPRSFGIRVVVPFTFTVNELTVHTRLYIDGFGFIVGRAGVSLFSIRFTRPPVVATEQRLESVLYGRAKG